MTIQIKEFSVDEEKSSKFGIDGIVKILLTSVLAAVLGYLAATAQIRKDVAFEKVKYSVAEEKIIREKSEVYFRKYSQLINFLDQNNHFEVKKAKVLVGEVRTAAFELAAYAPPELAKAALELSESMNRAITPAAVPSVNDAISLHNNASQLYKTFYDQLQAFKAQTNAALDEI